MKLVVAASAFLLLTLPGCERAAPVNVQEHEPEPTAFTGGKAGEEREVGGVKVCWCPPGKFTMGSPPMCSSSWRTVTASFPCAPNAGRCFATGSPSDRRRASTNHWIRLPVTIGLVSEARSKMVDSLMGARAGSRARSP